MKKYIFFNGDNTTQLNIKMPDLPHAALKELSAELGPGVQDIVRDILEDFLIDMVNQGYINKYRKIVEAGSVKKPKVVS